MGHDALFCGLVRNPAIRMLELIAGAATVTTHHPEPAETIAMWFLWIVCLLALIMAIVTAVRRRHVSSSYSADLVLAVFSPVMYWVLFAFGAVSHGGRVTPA